jgi:hypothetical protein
VKAIAAMAGASIGSWLLATGLLGSASSRDIMLGMLGPLVIACCTWALMERTYRTNPQGLTPVMIAAFAGKLVFFGAYVALMIRPVKVHPVPFIASFTGYFIGLYVIEALLLKRLLAGGRPS